METSFTANCRSAPANGWLLSIITVPCSSSTARITAARPLDSATVAPACKPPLPGWSSSSCSRSTSGWDSGTLNSKSGSYAPPDALTRALSPTTMPCTALSNAKNSGLPMTSEPPTSNVSGSSMSSIACSSSPSSVCALNTMLTRSPLAGLRAPSKLSSVGSLLTAIVVEKPCTFARTFWSILAWNVSASDPCCGDSFPFPSPPDPAAAATTVALIGRCARTRRTLMEAVRRTEEEEEEGAAVVVTPSAECCSIIIIVVFLLYPK
mmetsp:Transcript_6358/g.16182  ORF Transcript_6358/g.16182 Transcript_6358/m.16182 type:complete len:265 (+) Transcript_6358:238-1032(+)